LVLQGRKQKASTIRRKEGAIIKKKERWFGVPCDVTRKGFMDHRNGKSKRNGKNLAKETIPKETSKGMLKMDEDLGGELADRG